MSDNKYTLIENSDGLYVLHQDAEGNRVEEKLHPQTEGSIDNYKLYLTQQTDPETGQPFFNKNPYFVRRDKKEIRITGNIDSAETINILYKNHTINNPESSLRKPILVSLLQKDDGEYIDQLNEITRLESKLSRTDSSDLLSFFAGTGQNSLIITTASNSPDGHSLALHRDDSGNYYLINSLEYQDDLEQDPLYKYLNRYLDQSNKENKTSYTLVRISRNRQFFGMSCTTCALETIALLHEGVEPEDLPDNMDIRVECKNMEAAYNAKIEREIAIVNALPKPKLERKPKPAKKTEQQGQPQDKDLPKFINRRTNELTKEGVNLLVSELVNKFSSSTNKKEYTFLGNEDVGRLANRLPKKTAIVNILPTCDLDKLQQSLSNAINNPDLMRFNKGQKFQLLIPVGVRSDGQQVSDKNPADRYSALRVSLRIRSGKGDKNIAIERAYYADPSKDKSSEKNDPNFDAFTSVLTGLGLKERNNAYYRSEKQQGSNSSGLFTAQNLIDMLTNTNGNVSDKYVIKKNASSDQKNDIEALKKDACGIFSKKDPNYTTSYDKFFGIQPTKKMRLLRSFKGFIKGRISNNKAAPSETRDEKATDDLTQNSTGSESSPEQENQSSVPLNPAAAAYQAASNVGDTKAMIGATTTLLASCGVSKELEQSLLCARDVINLEENLDDLRAKLDEQERLMNEEFGDSERDFIIVNVKDATDSNNKYIQYAPPGTDINNYTEEQAKTFVTYEVRQIRDKNNQIVGEEIISIMGAEDAKAVIPNFPDKENNIGAKITVINGKSKSEIGDERNTGEYHNNSLGGSRDLSKYNLVGSNDESSLSTGINDNDSMTGLLDGVQGECAKHDLNDLNITESETDSVASGFSQHQKKSGKTI